MEFTTQAETRERGELQLYVGRELRPVCERVIGRAGGRESPTELDPGEDIKKITS